MPRHHDAALQLRIPRGLRGELDRLHETTRVPTSEVVRYLVETGLANYRTGKHFDVDALVEDVAEYVAHEAREEQPRTHAAA